MPNTMSINYRACAFTGHRPQRFTFGFDEEYPYCITTKELLDQEIRRMIDVGVTTFYCGMALGVDMWAAEIVLKLKKEFSDIQLIAVLPHEEQANKWSIEHRERHFNTLAQCDNVITLQTRYTSDCMHKRNRCLIDHARYLIAVYDGSEKGGTAYTVKYAKEQNREITIIQPDKLDVISAVDWEALELRKKFKIIRFNGIDNE